MKIQYVDSWVHFILFYGRSNVGMSRNVEYDVQRELNLDMETNYCTQEGHLLVRKEGTAALFGIVFFCFRIYRAASVATRAHLLESPALLNTRLK